MSANVRVSTSSNGDSHAAGRARLKLKLAAIAYVNSRHGIDTDAGLTRAGFALLAGVAIDYYEAIANVKGRERPVDVHLQDPDDSDAAGPARHRLKVAAIAYVNARHGVDADAGLSRVGLVLLAQTAIEYYEAIATTPSRARPVDPHLQMEGS